MSNALLEVRNLTHQYGRAIALNDVNLEVKAGEIFGLLGPNGAGKTTLLSIVAGLLQSKSGEVYFQNQVYRGEQQLRRRIGIVPQEIALYGELTARENLHFFGELYDVHEKTRQDRVEEILAAIRLTDRADERVSTFSGGMQRRLNLGIALVHQPELLLLDEPTVGVDPQSRNHIFEEVRRLNREGMTIVYTSHYMEEVQSLCSRIGIMDHGQLIACDTLSSLLEMLDGEIQICSLNFTSKLLERLRQLPEIAVHQEGADELRIVSKDVKGLLLNLAGILKEEQVELVSMELREPNLERVFLHLTGKALRD